MRRYLPAIWRNLLLLYLGAFLAMSAWGAMSALLNSRTEPAAVETRPQPISSWREMLGLWPPGPARWRRLLELGIPGLSSPSPRRLTRTGAPGDGPWSWPA